MLECRFKFRLIALYINTHHNGLNDTISRRFDPRSSTAIEDTQVVIDDLVSGLTYEPLERMFRFLTSGDSVMVSYRIPQDPSDALVASFLTPFGALRPVTLAGGVFCDCDEPLPGTGDLSPPSPVPTPFFTPAGVFEHCGGILRWSRYCIEAGLTSQGFTETNSFVAGVAVALSPTAVDFGDFFSEKWKRVKKGVIRYLVAGPPCQPFSGSGRRRGISDKRFSLLLAVADIAAFHLPDCIDIEE